ncbi:hypothetical protein FO440_15775 [Mucilaginibacter corticis]|uniref:Uncharacterized protein n=1 Tax=Mucilaginibacter corticis TaxID=2597670 RepID=A0A556MH48_9SPHI|nr:DUF6580 family putative transport protein [Mucilaginibacter corticis]TSJ39218.1 hypothetical protein FO440_15775 [Mucilaginibacter corticis]
MSLKKIDVRTIVLVLLIILAATMRLVNVKYQALSNLTPVGAIALFGGAYFTDKWKAYAVVLITLFLSDLAVNYMYTSTLTWYSGSLWVYLFFAFVVFAGSLIKKVNALSVFAVSLFTVVNHWLVMDLPWLYGTLYAHTWAGYALSLHNAIPFEKNMFYGDLIYCAILFGGFEFAKSKYTVLRTGRELAL